MSKKHSLYMATRLENGVSDLVCTVAKNREDLEGVLGTNIREVIQYKGREQAIAGLREQLPYMMESVPAYLYDSMVENGGFFETYL